MSDYQKTKRAHIVGETITTSICITTRHKQMADEANLSVSACTRLGIERAYSAFKKEQHKGLVTPELTGVATQPG